MKASELREKDVAALEKELVEVRKEQFNLRMQKAIGQLGQMQLMKVNRRSIARIKTILNEKSRVRS